VIGNTVNGRTQIPKGRDLGHKVAKISEIANKQALNGVFLLANRFERLADVCDWTALPLIA
jgi:hypothetical protein